MLFFWYCVDDYLAAVTHNAALGHVPWWVVLVAHVPFMLLAPGRRSA
jgi:hypothetical protein